MIFEVALVMGSLTDWDTLSFTSEVLQDFGISFHKEVISAHRTPERVLDFASQAHSKGFKIIIAGAGGAAHLPGMLAASSILPVIGIPINSTCLHGTDALLSIVQMPKGIPVATMAIGIPGAINAALLAVQILAINNQDLQQKIIAYKLQQKTHVETMNLELHKLK
ncbi:MAG: 5-(carboxyamino)imidazole ribonucleotide mutase [Alphaproteobacteria bacterium]|nr:5-(carboxyamino)imidazole ribonucleotide mutase [Alphaproteobacteria bacterium]